MLMPTASTSATGSSSTSRSPTTATGSFEFTLHDQLDHAANGNENDITLKFDYTARDFDGDTDTGSFVIGVDDDMPIVEIGVGTPSPVSHLALELDESVQPDGATNPAYDRYNGSETESGAGTANGGADDVAPVATNYNQTPVIETAPLAAEAIGSRTTDAGKIGQLFTGWSTAQLGADDPAGSSTKTLGFALSQGGNPAVYVATNLTATQTGAPELVGHDAGDRAIYLREVSSTVLEGRTAGADGIPGNGDDFVAFRITLNGANNPATATITVDQFMAIDHGADNPSIFDENLILRLADGASLGLKLDVTVTDFDGDPVSDSALVTLANNDGSFVSFDDDGPTVNGTALVTANVDEDGLNNIQSKGNADDAELGDGEVAGTNSAVATGNAGALLPLVNFGSDGPHPTSAFQLVTQTTPSDSGFNSKGGDVLIVSDGSTLTGYVDAGGAGFDPLIDRPVFTLTVGGDGSYTFTLIDQIDHPALTGVAGDDTENLLSNGGLDLSSFIVAMDGDGDTIGLAGRRVQGPGARRYSDDRGPGSRDRDRDDLVLGRSPGVGGGNDLYKVA